MRLPKVASFVSKGMTASSQKLLQKYILSANLLFSIQPKIKTVVWLIYDSFILLLHKSFALWFLDTESLSETSHSPCAKAVLHSIQKAILQISE